jgi:hypothetical protein
MFKSGSSTTLGGGGAAEAAFTLCLEPQPVNTLAVKTTAANVPVRPKLARFIE